MPDPCSSSNTNFAIWEWDAGPGQWDAVCECCDDGYVPDPSQLPPEGDYHGQQIAILCQAAPEAPSFFVRIFRWLYHFFCSPFRGRE